MSDLDSLQARQRYSFKNASLLEEVLAAAGAAVSSRAASGPVSGNKRLALIGDAVLRLSVLDEWYPAGGSTETGHDQVKDAGTNKRLQEVAKDWNLSTLLKENPSQAGQEPKTTLASTVEALIGAVWVDCNRNLAKVQDVIRLLQG